MDYAKFDNADPTQRQERGEPLTDAGEHVLEIVDVRENNGGLNTPGGYGFFMDFKVVSGPTAKGHLFTKKWFPMAAPSMGANGKTIPQNVKTERDFGSMKRAVGAAYGVDTKDAAAVKAQVTSVVLRNSIATQTAATPLKGRLVKCVAKAYKQTTFVDDFFPVGDSENIVAVAPTPSEVTQVKAVVPTAPAALPRFEHPQAAGMFYDASGAIFDASGKKVN